MNYIKQAQITVIVLFYLVTAAACFLSDIPGINDYKWNIDYSVWETNQYFADTIAIWSNLFLLSISPAIYALLLRAKRILILLALALPLFWGVVLLLALYQDTSEFGRWLSDFSIVIYGILFISITGVIIKLYFILKKIREENKIERLEKFQERALKKLEKLNPDINQTLLHEVLGEQGKALSFLFAANYYEEGEHDQKELVRLALVHANSGKQSMDRFIKRLQMHTKIPKN